MFSTLLLHVSINIGRQNGRHMISNISNYYRRLSYVFIIGKNIINACCRRFSYSRWFVDSG